MAHAACYSRKIVSSWSMYFNEFVRDGSVKPKPSPAKIVFTTCACGVASRNPRPACCTRCVLSLASRARWPREPSMEAFAAIQIERLATVEDHGRARRNSHPILRAHGEPGSACRRGRGDRTRISFEASCYVTGYTHGRVPAQTWAVHLDDQPFNSSLNRRGRRVLHLEKPEVSKLNKRGETDSDFGYARTCLKLQA
jgi:hypothetical protein